MATKRAFADVGSPETDDGRGDPSSGSITKRQRQLGKAKQSASDSSRKRARNIQRLLQRKQDLPANVVNDLERELAARQADFAENAFQRKRTAMIAKYHMVRFFERRKASRLVKQLERQIKQNPDADETDRLKKDLHVAKVDEAYTLYFPHLEPYVSLYGSAQSGEGEGGEGKTPAAKVSLRAPRPPMWSVVEGTLAKGPEALRKLRETRPASHDTVKKMPKRQPPKVPAMASNIETPTAPGSKQQKPQVAGRLSKRPGKPGVPNAKDEAASQLNRRERRRLMHQARATADDEDDEEGGGFFEGL